MENQSTYCALITAAGRGIRASSGTADDLPKQYRLLGGEAVLKRSMLAFLQHPDISQVICVIHQDDTALYQDIHCQLAEEFPHLLSPALGAGTRQSSVFEGLKILNQLSPKPDFVLIHDAVRPFVNTTVIRNVTRELKTHLAVLPAAPVTDTLKTVGQDLVVTATPNRSQFYAAQTPQGFQFQAIFDAHMTAHNMGEHDFTDDTALIEAAGGEVRIIEADAQNSKLTTLGDFEMAEARLKKTSLSPVNDAAHQSHTKMNSKGQHMMMYPAIGNGFDVHAFEEGTFVTLCGIDIPFTKRLKGHSDADVGLHALTDAIYGALADGDIGHHFPPSDPQWKGARSHIFLEHAANLVSQRGGSITHLDLTLICEAPKIGPHRDKMREEIANICQIPIHRISIKATTTEQLGFTGRGEGISALATATLMLPGIDE